MALGMPRGLRASNLLASASAKAPKPNILFIMTDQQHWRMLSCFGNPWVKTPHMDSIAATGARFDNAYTTFPQCVPARVSLVTGRMPSYFGVQQNTATIDAQFLPRINHAHTLGALFQAAGYDTVYGGKVHLPTALAGESAVKKQESVSGIGFRTLSADWKRNMAEACAAYLRSKHDKPFFMFASFINPHDICGVNDKLAKSAGQPFGQWSAQFRDGKKLGWPAGVSREQFFAKGCPPLPRNNALPQGEPALAAVPEYRSFQKLTEEQWRFQQWAYCRLVEDVDACVGTILKALRAAGLEDSTLIVFTSDHGDMNGAHKLANKRALYEEATRVPFIVSFKGKTKPGSVDAQHLLSTGLDMLPTVCDYAGIAVPPDLPGRSVRMLAEGKPANQWRDDVMIELSRGRALRTARYKYIWYADDSEQLFDVQTDPGELHDLKTDSKLKPVLEDHRRRLAAARARLSDGLVLNVKERGKE